ncbi:MAG TPA: hypothetical protein VFM23_02400 [Gemmatimonadales bacterium]|nr:hypothetical protein [Gemmatimonadales bacterium]
MPLRERFRACGFVLSDSSSFFLNIEIKEADSAAFRHLVTRLRAFEELFVPAASAAPPVRVTLVGWWPSNADTTWPSYLRVQAVFDRSIPSGRQDSLPVGLVSIDYGKSLRWSGRGPVPATATGRLAAARESAAADGVALRVHHVPTSETVYRWLLGEGVTLIGTTDLRRTESILQRLQP